MRQMNPTSPPRKQGRHQQIQIKLTLFRKNTLSAQLVLLSIVFELMFAIRILDVIKINYLMGISTFSDILLLFLLFTCSVKIGVYSRLWTWIALALALFALLRAGILVPFVLKPMEEQVRLQLWNASIFFCLSIAGFHSLIVCHRRQLLLETAEGKSLLSNVEDSNG